MTRDDILRMAREAGGLDLLCASHGFTSTLEHFARLVAAAEREACAKVCESLRDSFASSQYATGQPISSIRERFAAGSCAAAIRARG